MNKQTSVVLIIAGAVLFIILIILKNRQDRKKMIRPEDGPDSVGEENTVQRNQRDKL